MSTDCDIIRDMANESLTTNCSKFIGPPPAICGVAGAMNAKMNLFASQYSPVNIFESAINKKIRTASESILQGVITDNNDGLKLAYPNVAKIDLSWPKIEQCLWNSNGSVGGPNGNKYFKRNDAPILGMNPVYPIGHNIFNNVPWKSVSKIPLSVDYVMNTNLFAIVMFVLLVMLFAALMMSAKKSARNAPRIAWQKKYAEYQKLENSDPYKGSEFESYSMPNAECHEYVYSMEKQGYNMAYYRNQCGMPPL